MDLRAVLFDVDFTLAKPGPDLSPDGYRRLGLEYGLDLDPARYPEARAAAIEAMERHPELRHDEELWFAFTERIVVGMGGEPPASRDLAVAMTRLWERSENFDLYDDVRPVLAELRGHGLKLGLVSNGGREISDFVAHHALEVDCAIASRGARLGEAARVDLPLGARPARRRAAARRRWSATRSRTTSRARPRSGCAAT